MTNFEISKRIFDFGLNVANRLEDTPRKKIIKKSWNKANGLYELPIYTYIIKLLSSGVQEKVLKKICLILIKLGVDVGDPHSSSSELSIIIGFLSKKLLGRELSQFRRTVDAIEVKNLNTKNLNLQIQVNKIPTENYELLYDFLSKLRKTQRDKILSNSNHIDISKQVLASNDKVLSGILRRILPKVWSELYIKPSTKAVIYFRNLKTYAGDVDIYYWGPKQYSVIKMLSNYLIPLGYKIDHRSTFLISSIIRNKSGINNAYLGAYLFTYFFMGNCLEFNEGSFANRYNEDVLSAVSLKNTWPSVREWVNGNIETMINGYSIDADAYPGFKDLSFRTLGGILMGLSLKFKIVHYLGFEDFIDKLKKYLEPNEISLLLNSFYYLNHIRNTYQLVSERRWEMIDSNVIHQLNKINRYQSCGEIPQTINDIGKGFGGIMTKYIHFPYERVDPKSFSEYKNEADETLNKSYQRVTNLYINMANSVVINAHLD